MGELSRQLSEFRPVVEIDVGCYVLPASALVGHRMTGISKRHHRSNRCRAAAQMWLALSLSLRCYFHSGFTATMYSKLVPRRNRDHPAIKPGISAYKVMAAYPTSAVSRKMYTKR